MKFEYVRRTLINNEQEAPSLYLALCVIESLLEDLEKETGLEPCDVPMGEDQVPTKLISLCNTIQEIYRAKNTELVRNRDRLDGAVAKLEDTKKKLESIEGEINQLSEAEERYRAALARMNELGKEKSRLQQVQTDGQKLTEQIRQLEQSIHTGRSQQEEQIRKQVLLESEKDSIEKELAAYEESVLLPLRTQISALQQELSQKAAEKEALEQNLEDCKEQKHSLIYQITRKGLDLDKLNTEQEEKQTEYDALEMKCRLSREALAQLEAEKEERIEELGKLQSTVSELREIQLPELQNYVENERSMESELTKTIGQLSEEKEVLAAKLKDKEKKAEELDQNVTALKASIDVLTARCTDTDSQLRVLTDQIQELTGKTDEEKVRMRREQLENRIRELHRLEKEYGQLELRLKDTQRRLEEALEKRRLLTVQKEETESAEQQMQDILKTLEPYSTTAYAERSRKAREQLEFLTSVQNNLLTSMRRMREILHVPASGEEKGLLEMQEQFAAIKDALDASQSALSARTNFSMLEKR